LCGIGWMGVAMKVTGFAATLVAAALSAGAASATDNLIVNGGFETGDLTGWSTNPDGTWANAGVVDALGILANSGDYFASTDCVDTQCSLSQTVATTPGATYFLSFSFNPGLSADQGADTFVTFDGVRIADFNGGAVGWTSYLYSVTALASSARLVFTGFQDPAFNGLDDVSLSVPMNVTLGVPEPGAWATLLVGFGLAGAGLRRRRAVVAA
jgi:hypothetical protein